VKFYGRNSFLIEGTVLSDSLKESPYDRLPFSSKGIVRDEVWDLSKASAGISVRFITDSSSIQLKWTVLNDLTMDHMAQTGIKGIDLYFNNSGVWQYVGTGIPAGKKNEQVMINNMIKRSREFKLYLPLYDGIESLEIGIDPNCSIDKPKKDKKSPIVFYGTSITQGGCASRPGMAYTNIISRKINRDCINYGFSGNGHLEESIANVITDIDALFYVIECMPNINKDQVSKNTLPLVKIIRDKNPSTPIVFVENIIFENAYLDKTVEDELKEKNIELMDQYKKMVHDGIPNLFYINQENAIGTDHEGTVDGVHFTDVGFLRYANYLIKNFQQFGILNPNDQNKDAEN
tara:strand:- start:266 stop:1306 length:1041 start_codon:yes stop_codon:yes gene_type:complete